MPPVSESKTHFGRMAGKKWYASGRWLRMLIKQWDNVVILCF